MAGRFVRASKYRHIFGRSSRKEQCYDGLRVSGNAWDTNLVKANPLFLSVNWEASGGGAFAVVPLREKGRLPERIPLFRGHTSVVLDTDWSPFDDYLVASASDDAKIFLWRVPEDFSLHTEDEEPTDISPLRKLSGHSRKVGHVLFNPAAENVFATTSGDCTLKVWDVEHGAPKLTLKHADIVQSLSWNATGSLLVTTSRDKKLRIWDVRQEKAVKEVPGHTGAKNSRAVWMGEHDRVATTGFSRMSDRQLGLWDIREPKEPIGGFQTLDSISGVCIPFWDDGTQCLYLAGRGDGNIRYYEYQNDKFEYLSEYKSADPQRGIGFLPKRAVNMHENEVMRAFKTVKDSYIEPISFIVPRRAEGFQDDIYPPAVGSQPAMSADNWFSGESALPPRIDLESVFNGQEPATVAPSSMSAAAGQETRESPSSAKEDKEAPQPAPAAAYRAPKPSLTETKDSISQMASKFADKGDEEDDDDEEEGEEEDGFREPPRGAHRIIPVPTKAEPSRSPLTQSAASAKDLVNLASEQQPSEPTVAQASLAQNVPKEAKPTASTSNPSSGLGGQPAVSAPEANEPLQSSLQRITSLLEQQNRTIAAQSDRIGQLTAEVDGLKTRMSESQNTAGRDRDREHEKDERIKQLEKELEGQT